MSAGLMGSAKAGVARKSAAMLVRKTFFMGSFLGPNCRSCRVETRQGLRFLRLASLVLTFFDDCVIRNANSAQLRPSNMQAGTRAIKLHNPAPTLRSLPSAFIRYSRCPTGSSAFGGGVPKFPGDDHIASSCLFQSLLQNSSSVIFKFLLFSAKSPLR